MLKRDVDLEELKLSLLEAGGVDNWENYSDALENYLDVDVEADYEDKYTLLAALEYGGVSDWTWYEESLGNYGLYEDYLEGYKLCDEVLSYEDFVVDYKEKEKVKQEEGANAVRRLEETLAYAQQQTFYNLPVEKLEFPNVFMLIEDLYPEKTHTEVKDAYKEVIDNSGLFNLFCEGLDNKKELDKAKNEAIKKGYVTQLTLFEYARPRYIELLLKNKKLIPFIQKTLES